MKTSSRFITAAFAACAMLAFTYAASAQGASPSPSPTASPTAQTTIPIDGANVSVTDFATLFSEVAAVYLPLKDAPLTGEVVDKSPSDMPANDPAWHYAGTTTKDGKPHITVWVAKGLQKDSAIAAMNCGAALGLLDAGFGGATLQALYAKEKAADSAAGASAKDPWAHRKDLALTLAAAFMAVMSK